MNYETYDKIPALTQTKLKKVWTPDEMFNIITPTSSMKFGSLVDSLLTKTNYPYETVDSIFFPDFNTIIGKFVADYVKNIQKGLSEQESLEIAFVTSQSKKDSLQVLKEKMNTYYSNFLKSCLSNISVFTKKEEELALQQAEEIRIFLEKLANKMNIAEYFYSVPRQSTYAGLPIKGLIDIEGLLPNGDVIEIDMKFTSKPIYEKCPPFLPWNLAEGFHSSVWYWGYDFQRDFYDIIYENNRSKGYLKQFFLAYNKTGNPVLIEYTDSSLQNNHATKRFGTVEQALVRFKDLYFENEIFKYNCDKHIFKLEKEHDVANELP